jgi:predicted dehydrogenase
MSTDRTDQPVAVAIVGCGRVAYKHFEAVAQMREARLVAVCDIDPAKAAASAAAQGVPGYTDYHAMLAAHPEIELIHVLVPTGYHAAVVIDLAAYGRSIVVEKPMALTVADCDAMIAACAAHHAPLYVVYQNRFNTPVQAARRALEAGRFGTPVLGTVRVRWCRHQDYYDQDHWHGTWALDGGVMSQQASHHLDLLQWFMGPVESVQCQIATRLLDIEVEDTAAAIVRFRSGALGIYEATVATRPDNLEGSLSVLGEGGSVVISGIAVNQLANWRFADADDDPQQVMQAASEAVKNEYGNGHARYLQAVTATLRGAAPHPWLVDGAEGRRNIALLTALYEAAHAGTSVVPGTPVQHSPLGRVPLTDKRRRKRAAG